MAMIDYGGLYGVNGTASGVMVYEQAISLRQVTDGASHTILVGEDTGRGTSMNGEWANGKNIFDVGVAINTLQNNELWSDHTGGAQVLLCDGSVQFLADTTSVPLLEAASSTGKPGGEVFEFPP